MNWQQRFESHPQFGQAVQFASARPPWVLKATGFVAAVVFILPLIALAVMLVCAAVVTVLAWVVFNAIAAALGVFTGGVPRPGAPADDGRENVRVIHR